MEMLDRLKFNMRAINDTLLSLIKILRQSEWESKYY